MKKKHSGEFLNWINSIIFCQKVTSVTGIGLNLVLLLRKQYIAYQPNVKKFNYRLLNRQSEYHLCGLMGIVELDIRTCLRHLGIRDTNKDSKKQISLGAMVNNGKQEIGWLFHLFSFCVKMRNAVVHGDYKVGTLYSEFFNEPMPQQGIVFQGALMDILNSDVISLQGIHDAEVFKPEVSLAGGSLSNHFCGPNVALYDKMNDIYAAIGLIMDVLSRKKKSEMFIKGNNFDQMIAGGRSIVPGFAKTEAELSVLKLAFYGSVSYCPIDKKQV